MISIPLPFLAVKPFKCSMCPKEFRQTTTLSNHLKIHTGEKPYICTYCNKTFRQTGTLSNHLKIHTGEKPYECSVCRKQFRQSSTLNSHIRIHTDDKLCKTEPPPLPPTVTTITMKLDDIKPLYTII